MRTAVKKRDYKSSKLGTEGIGKCVHRVEVVSACALAQCPNSRVMFCAALTFFLPPPSQHKRMARMHDSSEVLLSGSGSPVLAHVYSWWSRFANLWTMTCFCRCYFLVFFSSSIFALSYSVQTPSTGLRHQCRKARIGECGFSACFLDRSKSYTFCFEHTLYVLHQI